MQTSDEALNLSPLGPTKTECTVLLRVQLHIECKMKSSTGIQSFKENKTELKEHSQELNVCYWILAIGWGKHELHSSVSNETLTHHSQLMNDKSRCWNHSKRFPDTQHVITRKCNTKLSQFFSSNDMLQLFLEKQFKHYFTQNMSSTSRSMASW